MITNRTGQKFPVPVDPTSIHIDFLKIEIQMYFKNRDRVQMQGYFMSLQDGLKLPQFFLHLLGNIYAHM